MTAAPAPSASCEILGTYDPEPGKPDRLVGRQSDGRFVLLESRGPNETMRQCGPAVSAEEGLRTAMNVLGGERPELTHPHALLKVSLALAGAALLKKRRVIEAETPALAVPGDPT